MSLSGVAFPIEKSNVYQRWQVERAAIETHKWYLSEKAGHDVGWDYALWNWHMAGHRGRWIKTLPSGEKTL